MVKSTGNGYTISLCNVLCSFVCFIFTLWIHVWWAVSSSWMPVYPCDHLSPLQADNQSCTAANVTPLHLWKIFFSPHRISGDRLCCVHLLDGWKKVFRSPEKKNQIPLLSYRCYLTQCSALYHTEDHSNQSVWVCICGFELSEVANPSMWNLCALFQPNGISRE